MRSRTARWLSASMLALGGCAPNPVEWEEPVALAATDATDWAFNADGQLTPRTRIENAASFPDACSGSVRVARDTATGDWYAVWWRARPDSTADLMASHSSNGVLWDEDVRVDPTDAGRTGCSRPPPAIATEGGNVYVAYAMTAREGPGIFASHSMDRGKLFHTPVAVVYGERIGLVAVAARGHVVAVAYEDPNTEPRRISLAISSTMGHPFQSRQPVSPPTGHARAPGVAFDGRRIAVTWMTGATETAGARMVRMGELR